MGGKGKQSIFFFLEDLLCLIPGEKMFEFSAGLVWLKIPIMGKTRLIASQNTPEDIFSVVYRFILGRRHFGVISWIHMIQKNQGVMPLLTSFLEPFSCSDLSCLCWSLLTSIQPRSMSDTVWWSKNKKRGSLLCTQTKSRFSSGTYERNRTLSFFI